MLGMDRGGTGGGGGGRPIDLDRAPLKTGAGRPNDPMHGGMKGALPSPCVA